MLTILNIKEIREGFMEFAMGIKLINFTKKLHIKLNFVIYVNQSFQCSVLHNQLGIIITSMHSAFNLQISCSL